MARKRIKINPKFRSKKGDDNRSSIGDDRLSQLPDEILMDILSFLPVKEAARTTVLSSRWLNLWNYSSCLDFDTESTLYKIGRRKKLRTSERRKYVKWVSYVLESNKATSITEFRICFDLTNSSQQTITEWLEHALSKQVQKLTLDLSPYSEGWNCPAKTCNFPDSLLNRSVVDYKLLKSLCLKYVGVSDQAVGFLLHNCPLLEKLVIHNSQKITKLEVSSLVLRHLEICYCYRLKSMKVSAPNLTSLYVLILEGLVLESVPKLVDLFVACWFAQIFSKNLRPTISCCISQLQTLSLLLDNSEASIELCKLPEMPKLKKLSVTYGSTSDESFLGLTSLIRASPYIRELVLKLRWLELPRSDENTIKFRHQHLNVLKVCGYSGKSSDVDLVNYFLENCVALQRIIIFPQYPRSNPYAPIPPAKVVAEKKAKIHAQQHLQAQVPNHIKFFIQ